MREREKERKIEKERERESCTHLRIVMGEAEGRLHILGEADTATILLLLTFRAEATHMGVAVDSWMEGVDSWMEAVDSWRVWGTAGAGWWEEVGRVEGAVGRGTAAVVTGTWSSTDCERLMGLPAHNIESTSISTLFINIHINIIYQHPYQHTSINIRFSAEYGKLLNSTGMRLRVSFQFFIDEKLKSTEQNLWLSVLGLILFL